MVPQTYPSILNPYTNRHEMVVKQLASTSGLQRWTDYIPVKLSASTRPAGEQTTDSDGFIAINTSQNTSTGVAFKDWVPVYFDNDATDAWVVSASGYIPIGASGGAIAILKSFGSNAHVYLPGANGVAVSGLSTNNYTLSDGSTGYSAVDGTAGRVLDGAGAVGANIATTAWTLGAGWSNSPAGTLTASAAAAFFSASQAVAALTVGATYKVRFTLSGFSSGSARFYAHGVTQQNAAYKSANGVYEEFFVASYANTGIGIQAGGSGFTGVISEISFQEVTGIHATQATTANKPALRRGLYNLLLNSATPATQSVTCAASPYTLALYGTGSVTLSGTGSGTLNGTGASDLVVLNFTPTAGSVTFTKSGTVSSFGLFQGTLTAAQILSEGGITLTTSAAASNSGAGRYSWQFDGSNDSLALGSVPFQMSDDHCVIAGARNDNQVSTRNVVHPAGKSTGPSVAMLRFSTGIPQAYWADDVAATTTLSHGSAVSSTCVLSARKVGNTKVLRVNGTQSATDSTVLGTTTVDTSRIGAAVWSNSYMDGAIGPIILIKGTVSDADLLTLERWVASATPNGPTF